ncbi:alpha/beta hydrolase family protein [Nocardia abscessus]|uniref:alpha/beta hydrolase family protein n=1 Tax=Nocardia abscessus TaxID=120957 RepID=UPI002455661F|nr:dienelactone hydrolase family protein [Nocardia abscessus]
MAPTLLPAMTGPHGVGNRRLFLTDSSRTDPISGSGQRKVSVTAWYPTPSTGTPARYLSNVDSYDETMALKLVNGLENANCSKSFWTGAVSCGFFGNVNPNNTLYGNIRSRDTRAVKDAVVSTDLGALPVVVYSPGFGIPGNHGSILAQELASHGYLVLTLSHTYESIVTEQSNGVVLQNGGAVSNQWQKVLTARLGDVNFVINQLGSLPNGIGNQADLSKVAAVGHSYGGYTALEQAYHDPRVKAVAVLDGTAGYDGTENHAQNNGVQVPVMLLSGDIDLGDNYLVGGEHGSWATYRNTTHGPLHMLEVAGTKHFAFTDIGLLTVKTAELNGSINPSRAMALHTTFTRVFLDQYLRGIPTTLLDGTDPAWPEVTVF